MLRDSASLRVEEGYVAVLHGESNARSEEDDEDEGGRQICGSPAQLVCRLAKGGRKQA
jgi:hypothetical protein